MAFDWHPVLEAKPHGPDEWVMQPDILSTINIPYAIIRRFQFEDDVWYRAVTYAEPERRQLLGWFRTLDTAAQFAWDDKRQRGRENLHVKPPSHQDPPGWVRH